MSDSSHDLAVQVRDALGLTYDVSFELSLYDRLCTGWFVCHVTSTHAKIDEALDASLRVLRSLPLQRVTPRELLRAKRTVLTRHESEMKVQDSHSVQHFPEPLLMIVVLQTVSTDNRRPTFILRYEATFPVWLR